MAIQLSHRTQAQAAPTAASYGVGLPVGDGGAGAIAKALGTVGSVAETFAAKKQGNDQIALRRYDALKDADLDANRARGEILLADGKMEEYAEHMRHMDVLASQDVNNWADTQNGDTVVEGKQAQLINAESAEKYATVRRQLSVAEHTQRSQHEADMQIEGIDSMVNMQITAGDFTPQEMEVAFNTMDGVINTEAYANSSKPQQKYMNARLTKQTVDYVKGISSVSKDQRNMGKSTAMVDDALTFIKDADWIPGGVKTELRDTLRVQQKGAVSSQAVKELIADIDNDTQQLVESADSGVGTTGLPGAESNTTITNIADIDAALTLGAKNGTLTSADAVALVQRRRTQVKISEYASPELRQEDITFFAKNGFMKELDDPEITDLTPVNDYRSSYISQFNARWANNDAVGAMAMADPLWKANFDRVNARLNTSLLAAEQSNIPQINPAPEDREMETILNEAGETMKRMGIAPTGQYPHMGKDTVLTAIRAEDSFKNFQAVMETYKSEFSSDYFRGMAAELEDSRDPDDQILGMMMSQVSYGTGSQQELMYQVLSAALNPADPELTTLQGSYITQANKTFETGFLAGQMPYTQQLEQAGRGVADPDMLNTINLLTTSFQEYAVENLQINSAEDLRKKTDDFIRSRFTMMAVGPNQRIIVPTDTVGNVNGGIGASVMQNAMGILGQYWSIGSGLAANAVAAFNPDPTTGISAFEPVGIAPGTPAYEEATREYLSTIAPPNMDQMGENVGQILTDHLRNNYDLVGGDLDPFSRVDPNDKGALASASRILSKVWAGSPLKVEKILDGVTRSGDPLVQYSYDRNSKAFVFKVAADYHNGVVIYQNILKDYPENLSAEERLNYSRRVLTAPSEEIMGTANDWNRMRDHAQKFSLPDHGILIDLAKEAARVNVLGL